MLGVATRWCVLSVSLAALITLIFVFSALGLFFSALQPLDKLLHLVEEGLLALAGVGLAVPLEDHLLRQHVTLVQHQHQLAERLHERHVLVAVLLHLGKCERLINVRLV